MKGGYSGPYPPSAKPQGILRQLWALNRGWEFFIEKRPKDVDFSRYLRIRPDLWFHEFEMPHLLTNTECLSPWWSRWGGMNDRVAVLGRDAAEVYFTAYKQLQALLDMGAPLHPESLMAAAMETKQMYCQATLRAWFTTVRKDGTVIEPDPQPQDLADMSWSAR